MSNRFSIRIKRYSNRPYGATGWVFNYRKCCRGCTIWFFWWMLEINCNC